MGEMASFPRYSAAGPANGGSSPTLHLRHHRHMPERAAFLFSNSGTNMQ
jgi:hypothetical protein